MSEKLGPVGGNLGDAFDDGVLGGVKMMRIVYHSWVSYIKIEYEKDGKIETREHGGSSEITTGSVGYTINLDYPDEYITAVGGTYGRDSSYVNFKISSLKFKTSRGRTITTRNVANPFAEFMLEGTHGGKLVGFHGRSSDHIDAIGAYFLLGPGLEKADAVGGNLGDVFDDGLFDDVKKITVGKDHECVTYIKVEYEKDGKSETREHGTIRGELNEFAVDYPSEAITSVGGSYGHVIGYRSVLITSLIFKTSSGRTSPMFGVTNPLANEFVLEAKNGGKLVGFHGRSGDAIDAIGAYFFLPVPEPPELERTEAMGGSGGDPFDDGVFDGVKKITVGRDGGGVTYIKIEYEKNGKLETREHGRIRFTPDEFVVDHPNEFITSVGGRYGVVTGYASLLITSLVFKTSSGRTSPRFGVTNSSGNEFTLEGKNNGGKILGFHGRSGHAIDAIGVYIGTGSTGRPEKLELRIGEGSTGNRGT